MIVFFFGVVGLLAVAGTACLYLFHISPFDNQFASFMGGVAGPLLSFLALMAVVTNQATTARLERRKRSAEEHLRWIDAIYRDIAEDLDAKLQAKDNTQVTLSNVLDSGALPAAVNEADFQRRITNFTKLLGQYCEAVAIYRDNHDPLFDVRILVDRGARLLDKLKVFTKSLGGMGGMTIEFCDMHLRGEKNRARAEAMQRPTRQ